MKQLSFIFASKIGGHSNLEFVPDSLIFLPPFFPAAIFPSSIFPLGPPHIQHHLVALQAHAGINAVVGRKDIPAAEASSFRPALASLNSISNGYI
jgi:hypothetical protein